jgi:four helix bundle protein
MQEKGKRTYDLEERLLQFSTNIIKLVEELPNTRTGNHVANQLLGSGTSPYANHAEAQAAESRNDFIHKLRICLKELRETKRWIMLIQRAALLNQAEKVDDALLESEELIKIFVQSIRTAESKRKK